MVTNIFGRTPEEAAAIVSINGGFNLGTRLIFPIFSDYLAGAYWAFVIAMWILTACYGVGFGTIPAFLTDRFGPQYTD
ncbi:unnamed protein product [Allacma fusca]|uniref:Uncharacterized protein n=1 Tax=Allacma fusca TaxID=39272 RepID=A0A8J2KEY7_9HEXA|nr:unnamed protein product [Allacma fusca]